MISRMAVRGILFLTLFTGMCVADPTVTEKDTPSCPCVPKNLALGAAVVQSSTYENLGAERAVDGNRNSILPIGSCSLTNRDLNPWWRVDLQEEQGVTRVVITNRGDTAAERINGAEIRIGNSLDNNGNSNELAATVESIPAGVTKTFEFKPIKGRYVHIIIPGRSEFLSLCEVEVFADNPTASCPCVPNNTTVSCPCVPKNLALGAAAVQSSTHDNLGAERAVDGNWNSILAGGSCSHTYEDLNPWWRVDLLEEQAVTRVVITNRGDCCAVRIYRAEIRIGNSPENNGNNNALVATVDSLANGATKTFEFKPIKGRYVNIVIPGRNEYLTLCEVEVFADNPTASCPCVPKNLALGAAAVQSSTYENLGAERAVDGNRNPNLAGGSCSHTDEDLSPWWRVDLLKEQAVTRVVITNRGDTAAVRIYGAQIRIGNSLENNGNSNALAATVESMTLGETKTFVFKPIKGQYVNIFIPVRMEYLTLCEVEVFAD